MLSYRIFVQILDKMVNNKDFLKVINKPIMLLYAFAYVVWLDSFFKSKCQKSSKSDYFSKRNIRENTRRQQRLSNGAFEVSFQF